MPRPLLECLFCGSDAEGVFALCASPALARSAVKYSALCAVKPTCPRRCCPRTGSWPRLTLLLALTADRRRMVTSSWQGMTSSLCYPWRNVIRLFGRNLSERHAQRVALTTPPPFRRAPSHRSLAPRFLQRAAARKARLANARPEEEAQPAKTDASTAEPAPAARPSPLQRCGQLLLYGLLVLLLPGLLNYAALQREQTELMTEGMLYDIGQGQKLFLRCEGEGKPTVVLDAPAGRSSDVWLLVLRDLSQLTRVCVFDRAGLGFSHRPMAPSVGAPPSLQPPPYTAERAATDLRQLLTEASPQPPPLLLVGAELGAANARVYAHMYPGSVSDLVLVDPLTEELLLPGCAWARFLQSEVLPPLQTLHVSAAAGVSRVLLMLGLLQPPPMETAAAEAEVVTNRQKHLLCHPRHASTTVDEHFFLNFTAEQLSRLSRRLPTTTVTIVTGNYHDATLPAELNTAWASAATALEGRYGARRVVIDGADGSLMYRQSGELVNVLKRLVKTRRAGLEDAEAAKASAV